MATLESFLEQLTPAQRQVLVGRLGLDEPDVGVFHTTRVNPDGSVHQDLTIYNTENPSAGEPQMADLWVADNGDVQFEHTSGSYFDTEGSGPQVSEDGLAVETSGSATYQTTSTVSGEISPDGSGFEETLSSTVGKGSAEGGARIDEGGVEIGVKGGVEGPGASVEKTYFSSPSEQSDGTYRQYETSVTVDAGTGASGEASASLTESSVELTGKLRIGVGAGISGKIQRTSMDEAGDIRTLSPQEAQQLHRGEPLVSPGVHEVLDFSDILASIGEGLSRVRANLG